VVIAYGVVWPHTLVVGAVINIGADVVVASRHDGPMAMVGDVILRCPDSSLVGCVWLVLNCAF
jgi:hypothetical protein